MSTFSARWSERKSKRLLACSLLLLSGVSHAIVCPPQITVPPPTAAVEGQVIYVEVGEANPVLSTPPPDVAARWTIDGATPPIQFAPSGTTQFSQPAPWTPISPTGYEFRSGAFVRLPSGSAGGYTVRFFADGMAPNGCDTISQALFVNVVAPTAPIYSVSLGSGQTTTPGTSFADHLIVHVENNGAPLANAEVRFRVISGDLTVRPPFAPYGTGNTDQFVLTSPGGDASVGVDAGAIIGTGNIEITVPNLTGVTQIPNVPFTIALPMGSHSLDPVPAAGGPYTQFETLTYQENFSVTAIDTPAMGTPTATANVPIRFTISGGDATLVVNNVDTGTNSQLLNTDAGGQAFVRVKAGAASPSTFTLTASAEGAFADAAPVVWQLQNLAEPSLGDLVIVGGDNQFAEPGLAFPQLLEVDVIPNGVVARAPEGGITIKYTVLSGDAGFLAARGSIGLMPFFTDLVPANGTTQRSQAPLYAGNSTGPVVVEVDAIGFPKRYFSLNVGAFPTALELAGGDNQSGVAGTTLPNPIIAAFPAGFVPGSTATPITFNVLSGDVFLNSNSGPVRTLNIIPSNGASSATVVLGQAVGAAVIEASYPGLDPVRFNVSVLNAAGLIQLTKLSGDNQTGQVNTRLANPLVVGVADATAIGTVLSWRVVSGSASLLGANNGVLQTLLSTSSAQAELLVGSSPGLIEVEVSGAGLQAIRFRAQGELPIINYRLEKLEGDNAVLNPNVPQALRVGLTDGGQPLSNFPVSWSILQGPAFLQTTSTTTDNAGESLNSITAVNTGLVLVRATVDNPNGGSVSTDFVLNTPSIDLKLISQDAQTGAIGTDADELFTFQLFRDGLVVPGELIQFSLNGAGTLSRTSATTDSAGKASVGLRYGSQAGAVTVLATAFNGSISATATASAFLPTLAILSGNNQAGQPGQLLAQPIVIKISQPPTPQQKGLRGAIVTWTVTCGNGSLASATTQTDTDGKSSNQWHLGPQPGCNEVKASIAGVGQVVFTANGQNTASIIEIVSGNNQSVVPQSPSDPLVVRVRTSAGAPVANTVVVFEPVSSAVSVEPAEAHTNDQGLAQTIARIGLPGAFQVRAKIRDASGAQPVLFSIGGGVANTDNLNPDQRNVARAIDSACPQLATMTLTDPAQMDLLQRCSELVVNADEDAGDVGEALTQMLGEEAGSQNQAALAAAAAQFDNLKARMAALRSGMATNGFQNLSIVTNSGALPVGYLPSNILGLNANEAEAGAEFSRWGFFATGTIGRGKRDPGELDPGFDYRTYGITAGVDYRFSDNLVLGGAIGFNRNDNDLRDDQGGLESSGTTIAGYATWYSARNFYLDGVLTLGRNQFDLERRINYTIDSLSGGTTVIDQVAKASPDGDQQSLSMSFGKDWNRGAWGFGPYLRANYTKIDFDGYTERMSNPTAAGAGLALTVEDRSLKSLQGILGGKVSYTASTSWGVLMPYAQLEWVKEFEDDQGELVTRFAFDPTQTAIIIQNDVIDTDYLNFGLGLSGVFANGKSAFLYYERTAGQGRDSQQSLAAGLRIEF